MRKLSHYLRALAGAVSNWVNPFDVSPAVEAGHRPSTVYLEHSPKQVGKIALASWPNREIAGNSNDWNKSPLRRFLSLDTGDAFASALSDKYYHFKIIFSCCFGIAFYIAIVNVDSIESKCDVKWVFQNLHSIREEFRLHRYTYFFTIGRWNNMWNASFFW